MILINLFHLLRLFLREIPKGITLYTQEALTVAQHVGCNPTFITATFPLCVNNEL